jgi:hypothetical protein
MEATILRGVKTYGELPAENRLTDSWAVFGADEVYSIIFDERVMPGAEVQGTFISQNIPNLPKPTRGFLYNGHAVYIMRELTEFTDTSKMTTVVMRDGAVRIIFGTPKS